jgi:hypothetical protein
LIDPGAQQGDLLRGQPGASERHHETLLKSGHQLNQPAAGTVSWLDDDPGIAACECPRSRVQAKTAALRFRSMTRCASLCEDGLNVTRKLRLDRCRRRQHWSLALTGSWGNWRCRKHQKEDAIAPKA